MRTSERGKWAEAIAAHFLERKGFKVLARNFSSRFGEIDIVAHDRHDNSVVFAEVRYRGKGSYILPQETLTAKKQQRIKVAASIYLNRFGLSDAGARFDVVCISRDEWFKPVKVWHIVDAF